MNIKLLGNGDLYHACLGALCKEGHRVVSEDYDLIVLANHNQILKKEECQCEFGAINCHRGSIPAYRGSSVLNWQIINGEIKGGVTIMQVDEGIDTGDVLGNGIFDILLTDTIAEVRVKANTLIEALLPKVVRKIETRKAKPLKQADIPLTPAYWHHRKPGDSRIIFKEMSALQVYNLVRACENPYPPYLVCEDGIMNVKKARLLNDNFYGVAGRVVRHVDGGSVVVARDRGVWVDAYMPIGEQLW